MTPRRGFELYYFPVFASYSGYVMFRNVYLEEIGMSGTQMGIVGFLFPLCTIVALPLWGIVADWKGASGRILYASAVVAGLSALVLSTGMSYEGVRAYGSIAFGIAGLAIGYLIGIFETELVFYVYTAGMALVVALLSVLPVEEPDALGSDLGLEVIVRLLNRQSLLLLATAFALGL